MLDPLENEEILAGYEALLTDLADVYEVTETRDDTGGAVEVETLKAGALPVGIGPVTAREAILANREDLVADAVLYFTSTANVDKTDRVRVEARGRAFTIVGEIVATYQFLKPMLAMEYR